MLLFYFFIFHVKKDLVDMDQAFEEESAALFQQRHGVGCMARRCTEAILNFDHPVGSGWWVEGGG